MDEQVLNALQSPKDRLLLLRIEQECVSFVHKYATQQPENTTGDRINNSARRRKKKASLVFPAMNSYHRLLIHKTAERFGLLSKSDGTGEERQTNVTCGPASKIPLLLYQDFVKQKECGREGNARGTEQEHMNQGADTEKTQRLSPSRQRGGGTGVYIPPRRRKLQDSTEEQQTRAGGTVEEAAEKQRGDESPSTEVDTGGVTWPTGLSGLCITDPAAADKKTEDTDTVATETVPSETENIKEEQSIEREDPSEVAEGESVTQSPRESKEESFKTEIEGRVRKGRGFFGGRTTVFDLAEEDGESFDNDFEVREKQGTDVSEEDTDTVEEPTASFDEYKPGRKASSLPSTVNSESVDVQQDTSHILEVYDFSPSVKTVNIRRLLAKFEDTAYRIKWVDETHTLVVFRDSALAKDALATIQDEGFKLRSFAEASELPKTLAGGLARPAAPRPKKDTTVARRMIFNALQIPHKRGEAAPKDNAKEK